MIDVRKPERVQVTIKEAKRQFEKNGPVPNAARALVLELADAITDSGPLEMGISAGQWLRAQGRLMDAVKGLQDDRAAVQVVGAMRGLRAARRAFRLGAWSARWRRRFGGSARAVRIQLTVLFVLLVGIGGVGGGLLLKGDVRAGYVLPGLVFAMLVYWLLMDVTAVRLVDAALAREAASQLAVGRRALSAARLAGGELRTRVEVAIAAEEGVLVARRMRRQRWEQLWYVPYAQITSFASDASGEPVRVTLDARERQVVLEYRWRTGEGRGDYQHEPRAALLTILDRRTRPWLGEDGREPHVAEQREAATDLG